MIEMPSHYTSQDGSPEIAMQSPRIHPFPATRPATLLFIAYMFLYYAAPVVAQAVQFRIADRVFTWACVYSRQPVRQLMKSMAGLLVIDPDFYDATDLRQLHKGGRTVIAYLSVGEAESYRWYSGLPDLRDLAGPENPEWKGNFQVAYADPRWQGVLSSYTASILAKGFDGLFLDVVDAWQTASDTVTARRQMTDLLCGLADQAIRRNPDAILLLQNSHELFEDPRIRQRFAGMTQEGLYATWQRQQQPAVWFRSKLAALTALRRAGFFVGLLEYTRSLPKMRMIQEKAYRNGLIPYFSTRSLDRLFLGP